MNPPRIGLLLLAVLALAGCETVKPLYHWGNYPSLTYLQYSKPDKATPEFQIEALNEDLTKASAKGLKAPPGLHAHLGYCYLQIGRLDDGVAHLQMEKQLFPESAQFIDRMLENLRGKETT